MGFWIPVCTGMTNNGDSFGDLSSLPSSHCPLCTIPSLVLFPDSTAPRVSGYPSRPSDRLTLTLNLVH
jgi:hypothetical protein